MKKHGVLYTYIYNTDKTCYSYKPSMNESEHAQYTNLTRPSLETLTSRQNVHTNIS